DAVARGDFVCAAEQHADSRNIGDKKTASPRAPRRCAVIRRTLVASALVISAFTLLADDLVRVRVTRGTGADATVAEQTLPREKLAALRAEPNVQSIQMIGSATVLNSNWSSGAYAYDGAGNITQIGNDRYLYDPVNRLVSASVNGTANTQTYAYDAFGNRLNAARSTSSTSCVGSAACESNPAISSATNRLSTAAGTYDAAGNLVAQGSYAYAYDVTNTVKSTSDGVTKREYIYTADDERLAAYSQ